MKYIYIFIASIFSTLIVSAQNTGHFESGISIRNKEKSHYHKMVTWDDALFEEFAYYETNENGSILAFMNFRVIFPDGFDKNADTKYPTTVMLHGAGESGRKWTNHFEYEPTDERYDNNGHQLLIGGQAHRDAILGNGDRSFPGIAIYPQCSYNGAWNADNTIMLTKIIEYMIDEYDVDPYRIYLHGLSNGGKGTWDFATERPDLFAAILPMAGMGSDKDASTDSLVTTGVWIFQGENDTNPSQGWTEQWVNDLTAKGGNPKYTLYEGIGHDPTFYTAYEEPEFFSWMLQFNKKDIYLFDDLPECVSDTNSIKLGFSAGYLGYQWKRDGNPIEGATSRYFTANTGGTYTVEFKQKIDSSWVESNPIFIDGVSTGGQPNITASGSLAQPVSSGAGWDTEVTLSVPDTLYEYRWYKDGELISGASAAEFTINNSSAFGSSDAGVYVLSYGQESNCATNESTPIEITYTDPQPTDNPPTGLAASATSADNIELEWSDVDYETYYEVWSRQVDTQTDTSGYPGTDFKLTATVSQNTTSFTNTNLEIGTEHEFYVRAIRPDGSATFSSSSVSATIEDTVLPSIPEGLKADSIGESFIGLAWEPSSDNHFVYKYELYQDGAKLDDILNDTTSTEGTLTYDVSGLELNTTYNFTVRAVDYSRNKSAFSAILEVTTKEVLEAREPNKTYTVYPNPSTGFVTIKSAYEQLDQPRTVQVYDMSGAMALQDQQITFSHGEATINLSELRKGYYIIRLNDESYPVIKK